MSAEGLEYATDSPRKTALSAEGGAQSGALRADPELLRLVEAWPTLPEALHKAILAMLGSVDGH